MSNMEQVIKEKTEEIINKMKEIKDVSTFMNILNTVSNSMDTNLTTKQILSFYNVGKDILKRSLSSDDADLVNIQQLYLHLFLHLYLQHQLLFLLLDFSFHLKLLIFLLQILLTYLLLLELLIQQLQQLLLQHH